MTNRQRIKNCAACVFAVGAAFAASAATNQVEQIDGFRDTPMLPGNKWHVHNPGRQQPRVATPGGFDQNQISWCNWSASDKRETSAALRPGASTNGGWTTNDISRSGLLVRDELRSKNPAPPAPH